MAASNTFAAMAIAATLQYARPQPIHPVSAAWRRRESLSQRKKMQILQLSTAIPPVEEAHLSPVDNNWVKNQVVKGTICSLY
jgi:hypothetical protein